jgi:hypothetical protein
MQPVGTVVAFGAAPTHDVSRLDATALACDILGFGDDLFARIKQAEGGSLLLLLAEADDDPALAAVSKASRILRMRGGGEAVVVLPAIAALPGPQARGRLQRAAQLTDACVVQPVAGASWGDAVRCFVEPLAVFGLLGVDPREVHGLLSPRSALLHRWQDPALDRSLRDACEVLVSCRLRPSATLKQVDAAARRVTSATSARLVLAGPEVDDGPSALAAVFLDPAPARIAA